MTAGSLCAITGLLDNTSEPLPATAGARLEQCPLKGTCCSSQERLTGVPASDAAPLPHSKQVLGTPRSRIKPSLCTSPAGSLAQSKPYNNKLGCESETKNNSVRKQISGSGCQGVITLNNRQSIISTVMRDVLTVSFQNGKQADGFRIKNTGTERKKEEEAPQEAETLWEDSGGSNAHSTGQRNLLQSRHNCRCHLPEDSAGHCLPQNRVPPGTPAKREGSRYLTASPRQQAEPGQQRSFT